MDLPAVVSNKIWRLLSPKELLLCSHVCLSWRTEIACESLWKRACSGLPPLCRIQNPAANVLPSCPTMEAYIDFLRKLHMWKNESCQSFDIAGAADPVTCIYLHVSLGVLFAIGRKIFTIFNILDEKIPSRKLKLENDKRYLCVEVDHHGKTMCLNDGFDFEIRDCTQLLNPNFRSNKFDEVFPLVVSNIGFPPGSYTNIECDLICSCVEQHLGVSLSLYQLSTGKLLTTVLLNGDWSIGCETAIKENKLFVTNYSFDERALMVMCFDFNGRQLFRKKLPSFPLKCLRFSGGTCCNFFLESKEVKIRNGAYLLDKFNIETGEHLGRLVFCNAISCRACLVSAEMEFVVVCIQTLEASVPNVFVKLRVYYKDLEKSCGIVIRASMRRAHDICMKSAHDLVFLSSNPLIHVVCIKPSGEPVLLYTIDSPFIYAQICCSWIATCMLDLCNKKSTLRIVLPVEISSPS